MSGEKLAALISASRKLAAAVEELSFSAPVAYVYNPLKYARLPYEAYLSRFARTSKRVVFLGMNPGPWGMAQTGVPFGEVAAVRDWMGIEERIEKPSREHPKRPVQGFNCPRSEVSGRRFWGLIKERFVAAETFFKDHFVANYCPLSFIEASGRNRTPDRLKPAERDYLFRICDTHLEAVLEILEPEWAIGIGKFTEKRILEVRGSAHREGLKVTSILHPSPANPTANRKWAEWVTEQLESLGVWA